MVLFLHGNAENISTHIGSVYWLPEQGYEVVLLDYRGYGRSEGVPQLGRMLDDVLPTVLALTQPARMCQNGPDSARTPFCSCW